MQRLYFRGLWAASLIAVLTCLVAGCAEAPDPTEVLVVIDGDASLAASLSRLQVQIFDGTETSGARQQLDIGVGPGQEAPALPLSFSIAAKRQSDTRQFRVVVTGYDRGSQALAEQQVITSFHPHAAGRLDLYLFAGCENLCRENGQLSERTCGRGGMCGAIPVRTELPAAGAGDLGGYTVAPGQGSGDAGSDAGADAGSTDAASVMPIADASQGNAPKDAGGVVADAGAPTSDAGGAVAADARVEAGPVPMEAGSDAAVDVDADADADVDASSSNLHFRADPVLPTPNMACPSFVSGNMTIMGLTVQVVAGPRSTGAKAPLLFYWHGTGSSSGEVLSALPAAMRNEITDAGGLLISPNAGTNSGTNTSGTGAWYSGDFALADLVAACAVRDYNIDPRRIYTTGCSGGAVHASAMAFQRASYIAAVTANSGGLTSLDLAALQPGAARPSPVLTMHGSSADMVVVSFSTTSATLDNAVKSAGVLAIDCDHGGNHCGAPAALQLAAWQFMKDHPYGVSPEPYAAPLSSAFPSYCAIK